MITSRNILVVVTSIMLMSVMACAGQSKKIAPAEAKKLIDAGKVTVLDVRTPGEWSTGYVPTATLANWNDTQFETIVKKLDRKKPVVVYCAVGGRSAKASTRLTELGFTNVLDMSGGITAWKNANLPVVQP
ncbi:MAG TPA: rhodanese-like domain-containing protein [Chlorobiota bacterium]|nr:rhodanese-like domain-containing protein [Chlorobiota bacterium]